MIQHRDLVEVFGGGEQMRLRVDAGGKVLDFLIELHDHMEENGITQRQLAERIGRPESQVHRWLTGKNELKASVMFLLARAAGWELRIGWKPIRPLHSGRSGVLVRLDAYGACRDPGPVPATTRDLPPLASMAA